MDSILESLTIHITPANWFFGLLAIFLYAFILVHIIEKKTDAPKTAHPIWFYILCLVFSLFTDFKGSFILISIWNWLWAGVKTAIFGMGAYAVTKALGLIDRIERIMQKKLK